MSEIVRQTQVRTDDRSLTVSTMKLGHCRYDTVLFDDSADKRHAGKAAGRWVIDKLNVRSDTREDAMDVHREALHVARTEPLRDLVPSV